MNEVTTIIGNRIKERGVTRGKDDHAHQLAELPVQQLEKDGKPQQHQNNHGVLR